MAWAEGSLVPPVLDVPFHPMAAWCPPMEVGLKGQRWASREEATATLPTAGEH